MAPKRKKCPTPPHESPQTDASSGEESRTDPVPPRAEAQRKVDEEVEKDAEGGSDESSEESEPRSGSEDGTRAAVPVDAAEEGTTVRRRPAGNRRLEEPPGKRERKDGDAAVLGHRGEATKHETLKPSKPSLDPDTADETRIVKAVAAGEEVAPAVKKKLAAGSQQLEKRPGKRARKGSDANDEEAGAAAQHTREGSGRFQRKWSEKDEIKLLRGLIKFRKKKRLEPSTNVGIFQDFLDKKSVRFDFSPNESQLLNKIRKMKVKFVNGCKTGRIWKKPHDQKVAELSRVLWGGGEARLSLKKSMTPESASKIAAAAPSKPPEEFEDGDWAGESSLLELTSMGLGKEVLRIGMGMIDRSEMEELKERWQQLRMSELQVANDRAALVNHQARLFMDRYRRAKQQQV
ncbi:probable transcription factor At1g61730 [Syzygium oleosum]|uniref:probable transcription factor At1g61730 n=1 Tax=Syzygium oleosum TaxID=219896 RepID=UPI0011D1BB58|nr:probable transcription factor At1g61730 [Syzygium oleosum]